MSKKNIIHSIILAGEEFKGIKNKNCKFIAIYNYRYKKLGDTFIINI